MSIEFPAFLHALWRCVGNSMQECAMRELLTIESQLPQLRMVEQEAMRCYRTSPQLAPSHVEVNVPSTVIGFPLPVAVKCSDPCMCS